MVERVGDQQDGCQVEAREPSGSRDGGARTRGMVSAATLEHVQVLVQDEQAEAVVHTVTATGLPLGVDERLDAPEAGGRPLCEHQEQRAICFLGQGRYLAQGRHIRLWRNKNKERGAAARQSKEARGHAFGGWGEQNQRRNRAVAAWRWIEAGESHPEHRPRQASARTAPCGAGRRVAHARARRRDRRRSASVICARADQENVVARAGI